MLFIPLDNEPTVPKWLPRTQLWIGLDRWGVSDAASVLDARFQELGGSPAQETIEHRAARLEKVTTFAKFRERYLSSDAGVRKAAEAFELLVNDIARRMPTLQASAPSLNISIKQAQNIVVLLGTGPALHINWRCTYGNTLSDSELEVSLWRGHPPYPGIMNHNQRKALATKTLLPDVLMSEEACWVVQDTHEKKPMLPEAAAEFILNWWLEQAINEQRISQ